MAGTKLNNTKERLIEAAEILYTTTYVRAWAGCQNGEAVGKIIAEETAFRAEEREDGMTAGDLGMLVYDIHHGKVTVDIVDEPLCLGLADGLFGAAAIPPVAEPQVHGDARDRGGLDRRSAQPNVLR